MRVLILLTDLFDAIGGIQTFNRCLVKALDEIAEEKGWKVTILVLNDRGNSALASKYLGLSKYQCSNKNKLLFIFMALFASLKADVVFFGHVNFLPLSIILSYLKKNSFRCLIVYGIDVWRSLTFLQKLGISSIKKILTISKFTQEQMVKLNNLRDDIFLTFPCTLDPFYDDSLPLKNKKELNLPEGKMILSVSRLNTYDKYKNMDQVIESMPLVIKKIPDAFYVVVGGGNDRKRLEKLTHDLGLKNKVYFTGLVSAQLLPSYYDACNLFILTSTGEGFGIVFLEAMYHSKPCIGALSGAIPEVIEDEKSGFLVESDNKEILANRITELLSNEKLSQAIGEAGKKKFEKEFSFDLYKKKLKQVLCN